MSRSITENVWSSESYAIQEVRRSGRQVVIKVTSCMSGMGRDTIRRGFLRQASFTLDGSSLFAMDSSLEHDFTFSDGISFYVRCRTQEEIDRLWKDLSAGGRTEECGWLVDRYGISWQIVPEIADDMVNDPDPQKSQRVVKAILGMKKLDIEEIRKAYER